MLSLQKCQRVEHFVRRKTTTNGKISRQTKRCDNYPPPKSTITLQHYGIYTQYQNHWTMIKFIAENQRTSFSVRIETFRNNVVVKKNSQNALLLLSTNF